MCAFVKRSLSIIEKSALKFVYNEFLPALRKITKCKLHSEIVSWCAVKAEQGVMVSLIEASIACLPYVKQFKRFLPLFRDLIKLTSHKAVMSSSIR